ncbi:nicotinate-nucleotide--dimethylbenzimidazole phosphoribosyltransferase [compost metagenome]
MLDALKAEPLLQLDLLLGDGSGAALAVPMLQAACALHAELVTLDEGLKHMAAPEESAPARQVGG